MISPFADIFLNPYFKGEEAKSLLRNRSGVIINDFFEIWP